MWVPVLTYEWFAASLNCGVEKQLRGIWRQGHHRWGLIGETEGSSEVVRFRFRRNDQGVVSLTLSGLNTNLPGFP